MQRGETKERAQGKEESRLAAPCSDFILLSRGPCPFFLSLPTTKPLCILPSKCIQTMAPSCPAGIQAPVISHLDDGSNVSMDVPAWPPRPRFPSFVTSLWALTPQNCHRFPSLRASPALSPQCQTPSSHFLLSWSTGMRNVATAS